MRLIVRCGKDETDTLLAKKGVRELDLSGERPMPRERLSMGVDFFRGRCRGRGRSGVSQLKPHFAARVQGERAHVIPLRLVPA
jgi:hypothetical protein